MSSTSVSGAHGNGEYAPMPPVLGPVSPSPTRLKSCAGTSGTTVVPSVTQKQRDLGAVEVLLDDDPAQHAAACARATSRSAVTTTPLPAASPSSLTTYGGPKASRAAGHLFRRLADVRHRGGDVGRGHDLLGERLRALELRRQLPRGRSRRCPAPAPRPPPQRPAAPRARSRQGRPPMTRKCGDRLGVTNVDGGVLGDLRRPGVARSADQPPTSASRLSDRQRACSRAPDPMTRTSTPATLPYPDSTESGSGIDQLLFVPSSPGSSRRASLRRHRETSSVDLWTHRGAATEPGRP